MAACLRIVLLTWVLFVTNAKECDWDSHRNTSEFTIYPDDTFLQGISVSIFPSEIVGLVQGDHITVYVNYSGLVGSRVDLRITASDQDIIRVGVPNVFSLSPENAAGNVSVHGLFLGRTQLQFHFAAPPGTSLAPGVSLGGESDSPGQWWPARIEHPFEVSVVRAERILDHIFIGVATLMVIFANMAMGCAIDLNECKKLIKKPIAPAIGFACQFIIMPLVAFGVAALLKLTGGAAIGFFAAGCAPGGDASKFFTYLVGGDVSLSITMTLISTAAALFMMPLWLYTLGYYLLRHMNICLTIPFTNIMATLVATIFPVGIGAIIQHYRPAWAANIRKFLRPLAIFFIIFMFTFGTFCNLYMFKLFTPKVILAGCLLPYVGLVIGGLIAKLTCHSSKRIRTIAIETCIQNPGVAVLLMKYSLPQPDADIAMVPPIVVATFTPIPLIIIVAVHEIYYRCYRKDKDEQKNGSIYLGVKTIDDHTLTEINGVSENIGDNADKKNNIV